MNLLKQSKWSRRLLRSPLNPPKRLCTQVENSFTSTRPVVPSALAEYFLPNNLDVGEAVEAERLNIPASQEPEKILYKPALLVQSEVRYLSRKYNVEYAQKMAALVKDTNSPFDPVGGIRMGPY